MRLSSYSPWLFILTLSFFAIPITVNSQQWINEDFDGCALPSGWTTNIVSGPADWLFVLNSPDPNNAGNIDGTCMAMFDDDDVGSGQPASVVELYSPIVDVSSAGVLNLDFDYNFRALSPSSMSVDVFDGANWQNVLTVTANDCGAWGCSYPHFSQDVAAFRNTNFQIRFTYDDGAAWAWYGGFDNVVLNTPAAGDIGVAAIDTPSTSCDLSAATPITVTVENFGTAAQSGFDISLQVAGPAGTNSITETFAGSLGAGATAQHTFSSTFNLSLIHI